jgi:hypothetical protein
MLNESFRFAAGATSNTIGITWTAPADDSVSFVFVNARLEIEKFAPGRAERCIDVPWDSTGPPNLARVVEIHDFAPTDVPSETFPAITVPSDAFTFPLICFSTVPGAARYRLYHRPEDGVEALAAEIEASEFTDEWAEMQAHEILDAKNLAGKWHFFRVEAVTDFGVESRRKSWVWRAMDTSPAPAVSVTSGSSPGTYTFCVT